MRTKFDRSDRRLARLLSEDGRLGINEISERLEISGPTARTRLKSLLDRGLVKISGQVNVGERPDLTVAIVAIHATGHGRLNEVAKRLSELPFVTWVSIVTGRYDILCEMVFEGDVEDLYRFTNELLPGLAEPGIIRGSETFVVMKSHNKWVSLPKGVWEDSLVAEPSAESDQS